jgi:hypothetical protein
MLWLLYTLRKEQNSLSRGMGRPERQSECFGNHKNISALVGIELLIIQPIALSIYQLSYPSNHMTHQSLT